MAFNDTTDKKILSGAVCQPLEPRDHESLRYLVRGVIALGKDVTVVYPMTRDSSGNKMIWVDVGYQRQASKPPQGQKPEFTGRFKGTVFACTSLEKGYEDCKSSETESSDKSDPASVHIETGNLLHTEHNYYVYKSEIPRGVS